MEFSTLNRKLKSQDVGGGMMSTNTKDKLDVLVGVPATIIWRALIVIIIMTCGWTWNREVIRGDRHDLEIKNLQQCMVEQFAKKDDLYILQQNTVTKGEFIGIQGDIKDVKNVVNGFGGDLNDIKFFMGRVTQFMDTKGKTDG